MRGPLRLLVPRYRMRLFAHFTLIMDSRFRRPLRNLPDEATSGVVNDTIMAKPPPLWIPAFAGMTVVQGSPFAGMTAVCQE